MTTMNSMNAMNTPQAAAPGAERNYNRRVVYVVTERTTADGTRSFWTKVGAAFDKDRKSVV